MGYEAGFAMSWWGLTMSLFQVMVMVTGWVTYRFRRTRALTLAEFFERRYSRKFRIWAGTVAFVAGLVNFGIFPAVGARFFLYFLGLPEVWHVAGLAVPVFPALMAVLLATAVASVFVGGQVTVLITDFIQGAFANVVFLIVAAWLLLHVGWDDVAHVMSQAPAGHSKINPFDTGYVQDFNFKYFMIGVVGLFYGAVILSFMSGVLWGFATRATGSVAATGYALSVIPALWAFFMTGGGPTSAGISLIAGFIGLLGLDWLFWKQELAPPWWMSLRVMLTVVVVASLTVPLLG